MKRRQAQGSGSFPPIFRAISLASAIVVIVAGVTFAVMRSQEAKVTGNSVQAATANLLVGLNNTDFAAIQNGFAFNGLVPGQPAVPLNGHTIFLKNAGGTSLALGVAVSSAPLTRIMLISIKSMSYLRPQQQGSLKILACSLSLTILLDRFCCPRN